MSQIIEYRDVRPDGTVLATWLCQDGSEFGCEYGWAAPAAPWERQRRVLGDEEWVTIAGLSVNGYWQSMQSAD